jgi:HD-like signal output (HDOD) protein
MPGIDGEALLREAMARWPQVLRVVLSGDVKATAVERLMGLAQHLVAKPVEPSVLYGLIEDSLRARERLRDPALRTLVGQLGPLPCVPSIFTELSALLGTPRYELAEVVALVQRDPGVATNVLKLVNSAWFGPRTPVSSLREAIRHLGTGPLRSLVLAAGAFGGAGARAEALMREAMERFAVVEALALHVPEHGWLEPASTAAVVCDVGRLVVADRRPDEVARCEARVEAGERPVDAEVACFGADHAVLGAAILGQWGLPRELVDAVALHHQPAELPGTTAALALATLALEHPSDEPALAQAAALFSMSVRDALSLRGRGA